MKYVAPTTRETAFNCPSCGALAKQFWQKLRSEYLNPNTPLPPIFSYTEEVDLSRLSGVSSENAPNDFVNRLVSKEPFLFTYRDSSNTQNNVHNIYIAECFNCREISLWIHDRLVHPRQGEAPPANPDLSADIKRDYDEASSILDLSPRGAAALIRLCIQKLCKELGKPGKNISDDIAALVADGLDPRVQKALDAVRVIGNNAVHPGEFDLRDDRASAEILFKLLNLIADKMISEPKHVDEIYNSLPKGALEAIERRDKKGSN